MAVSKHCVSFYHHSLFLALAPSGEAVGHNGYEPCHLDSDGSRSNITHILAATFWANYLTLQKSYSHPPCTSDKLKL